jgi:hypothetical protein
MDNAVTESGRGVHVLEGPFRDGQVAADWAADWEEIFPEEPEP